jgi:O-antigen/teichoic acid export membrane protein
MAAPEGPAANAPAAPASASERSARSGILHSIRAMMGNVTLLGIGSLAARLLGVGTFIVLARALGVARFGVFTYAMSLALTIGVVIDMGQATYVGRLVAADPETGPMSFGHALLNKTVLTLVAALLVGGVTWLTGSAPAEVATLVLMTLWVGAIAVLDTLRSIARSLDRFGADSVANGGESAVRFAAVLAAWAFGAGLVGFGVAFLAEGFASTLGFMAWIGRRVRLLPQAIDVREAARLLVDATPLGLSALAFTGFYQLDQVFVRTMAGATASGLYGAAARVVFAANMVGGLVAMAVYPELVRRRERPVEFRHYLLTALGLTTAASTLVSLVLFFAARPLVLIYGPEFADAAGLLRVLAFVVAMNGALVAGMYAATALGRERLVLRAATAVLAANIVANVVFVPLYGAYAAAWISLAGEAVMAAAMVALSWDPGTREAEPVVAAGG